MALEKPDATGSSELGVDLGPPRMFLLGRHCQVVVQIAEIQLAPDTTNVAFRGDEASGEGEQTLPRACAFTASRIPLPHEPRARRRCHVYGL
jgi:hypothetical protein